MENTVLDQKMDPRVKGLWLDALRSEEYDQGIGQLRISYAATGEHRYCCLGVLCDLYAKEYGEGWTDDLHFQAGERMEGMMPKKVKEWAGFPNGDPVLVPFSNLNVPTVDTENGYTASILNDEGSTFGEIADLIEERL